MYSLVDADLEQELEASPNKRGDYLFLESHPDFPGQWKVQCFDPHYFFDFKDVIGSYRAVSPASLKEFLSVADELEYKVAFFEDPGKILKDYEALNERPDITLNSSFEGTVNGLLPYQVQGYNMLKDLQAGIAMWDTGPQPLWEQVLTPNGWRCIGDLQTGDSVIGSEGTPAIVEEIIPRGLKEIWEVEFNDGTSVRCSSDHLWTVDYWTSGSRKLGTKRNQHRRITTTTRGLLDKGLHVKSGSKSGKHGRAKFALPPISPVEFHSPKDLLIDPYCLGLLLGDGSLSHGPIFTTADSELAYSLKQIGAVVSGRKYEYRINGIRNDLRTLKIYGKRSWEKVIPPEYIYAPPQDRLALLQGLLDTDGSVSGSGASFTSTSEILSQQVAELCRSLGGYATEPSERYTSYTHNNEKRQGRKSFRTHLSLDQPLFRLSRKEKARMPHKQRYKRIVAIRPWHCEAKMVCIKISASDHLYITRGYTLTHNTGKSVLATALIKHHQMQSNFDTAFVVCKATNKENFRRRVLKLGDITSDISPKQKQKALVKGTFYPKQEFYESTLEEPGQIIVGNYENFKFDYDYILPLFEDRNVLVIWDEMPTKLKTRTSALYEAVKHTIFKNDGPSVKRQFFRPSWITQYMLSATPIENCPEDFFNCVTGDTEVEPIGDVTRAYKGKWKGPLIKFVTASGAKLSIGPNHPVLTSEGWINAQFLQKGDNVIRRPVQRSLSIEDLDKKPSFIQNTFDALRTTSQSVWMKRATSLDLHGDGGFFQGEIDIVDVNGFLPNKVNPKIVKESGKSLLGLPLTDPLGNFSSRGSLQLSVDGVFSPQTSLGTALHPSIRTLTTAPTRPQLYSHLPKPVGNQLLAHTQLQSDTSGGSLILNIQPFNKICVNVDTTAMGGSHLNPGLLQPSQDSIIGDTKHLSDLSDGFSLYGVETDEIVDIELIEWEGHLYDLSTTSGTYYANGIIASNCVRLMDPAIYGTVSEFRTEYVATFNFFDERKPETWHKLDKIGMKTAHITHQVDKTDPDIAKQFPEVFEDTFFCEWSAQDLKLYETILERGETEDINPLALINLLQMVCDEPSMLWNSAEVYASYQETLEEWEEIGEGMPPNRKGSEAALALLDGLNPPTEPHGKQLGLKGILEQHFGEKTLVFSVSNNSLMPTLEKRFDEWGITYVRYHGTEKQRQAAEDAFMEDPDIMVFLSSDIGSDSLDLWKGRNVVNYNLPWKWTTKTQRKNRIHRVISENEWNNVYTLVYSRSVEERKGEVIDIKRGYHDGVFKGKIKDQSMSARMTLEDLMFILGNR